MTQPLPHRTPMTEREFDQAVDAAFPEHPQTAVDEDMTRILARLQDMDPQERFALHPKANFDGLKDALAKFQAEYPLVTKDSRAKVTGKTKEGREYDKSYNYANLADVHEVCLPLLGKLGLSWSCKPTTTAQGFGIVYELAHGPSGEKDGGFWPLPDPIQTAPQAMGSLITYIKRYTFQAMTGIAPAEDDDDAQAAQKRYERREEAEYEEKMAARRTAAQERQQATATQRQTPAGPAPQEPAQQAQQTSFSVDATVAGAMSKAAKEQRVLAPGWFVAAWADICKSGPAARQSPYRSGDGGHLPWPEVFGRALAATIESPTTLAEYEVLAKDLRAIGADKLPWPWEGVTPVQRAAKVKQRLQEKADADPVDVAKELERRIQACTTVPQIITLLAEVDEVEGKLISEQEAGDLRAFATQCRAHLVGQAEEAELDPWASDAAKPVQDVELPIEDVPAEAGSPEENYDGERQGNWLDFEGYRLAMRALDATPEDIKTLIGTLDRAHGDGSISAEDAATLYDWATGRPAVPAGEKATSEQRRDWMIWEVSTCVDNDELDAVKDANNNLRNAKLLQVNHSTKVAAALSARRIEINGARA